MISTGEFNVKYYCHFMAICDTMAGKDDPRMTESTVLGLNRTCPKCCWSRVCHLCEYCGRESEQEKRTQMVRHGQYDADDVEKTSQLARPSQGTNGKCQPKLHASCNI